MKSIACKLAFVVTITFAAAFAVLPFHKINSFTAKAESGETDSPIIDLLPDDLSYEYDSRNNYYVVTGLSQQWLDSNPGDPENKPKLNIIIPDTYDNGINGERPVNEIGDFAFCSSDIYFGITDYSVTAVDFSQAENLTEIGEMAFYSCDFTEIDLTTTSIQILGNSAFALCSKMHSIDMSGKLLLLIHSCAFFGCYSLETIDLRIAFPVAIDNSAFSGCLNLKTVYLGYYAELSVFNICYVPICIDGPLGFDFVESIVFCNAACMKLALSREEDFLHRYSQKFTYEQEVTFDPNGGDCSESEFKQTKLFNKPFGYVKKENGAWERNSGYTLPSPGAKAGYNYKWTAVDSGTVLTGGTSLAAETNYIAVWSLIPTTPSTENLTPQVEPKFPAWAAWLIGAGGFVLLAGVCTGVYLFIRMKKLAPIAALPGGQNGYLTADEVKALRVILENNAKTTDKAAPLPLPKDLTLRERDVALLLLSGKTRKEIAAELCITPSTAKEHTHNILEKSECANQLEFVIKYGN